MKQVIFCTVSDLDLLGDMLASLKQETVVFASPGSWSGNVKVDNPNVKIIYCNTALDFDFIANYREDWLGMKHIYFIVSSNTMASTAFQAMIFYTLPGMLSMQCWITRLEQATIPLGLNFLKSFSEDTPV